MMFGSVSLFVDGSGTQEDVSNSSSVQLSLSLSLFLARHSLRSHRPTAATRAALTFSCCSDDVDSTAHRPHRIVFYCHFQSSPFL